jgi:hypothetical protein
MDDKGFFKILKCVFMCLHSFENQMRVLYIPINIQNNYYTCKYTPILSLTTHTYIFLLLLFFLLTNKFFFPGGVFNFFFFLLVRILDLFFFSKMLPLQKKKD